jgi:large subunit ribosomal protein L10
MLVAKNTLINVVLKEQGVSDLGDVLQGPTALVLFSGDPVAPARVLAEFAKSHTKNLPTAKGGRLQGARIEASAIERIAKLPPREQLLSELLGVLQVPLVQLVGVLTAAPRNLLAVMNNYADKLKEEGHGV